MTVSVKNVSLTFDSYIDSGMCQHRQQMGKSDTFFLPQGIVLLPDREVILILAPTRLHFNVQAFF